MKCSQTTQSRMRTKTFKTKKGVTAALKRAGLVQLPHRIHYHDVRGTKGYTATITVELHEDRDEVQDRGFLAECVIATDQDEETKH